MQEEKEQPQAAPNTGGANFPEAVIQQIMDLGYPRAAAIEALTVADGNPDAAVSYLLG